MELRAQATHKRLQRALYASVALAGCLFISNFLLALVIGWGWSHERIIVTPPVVAKPFTFTANQIDANYLEMMTLFWMNLRLNVTPQTVENQHGLLLHYVDAAYYGYFLKSNSNDLQSLS